MNLDTNIFNIILISKGYKICFSIFMHIELVYMFFLMLQSELNILSAAT